MSTGQKKNYRTRILKIVFGSMGRLANMEKTNKIKIAWFHSHFLYWMGGTKFIFEIARRLKDKAEITFFVEKVSADVRKRFQSEGFEIIEIGIISSNNPFYWLFFPFFIYYDMLKVTKYI